MLSLRTLLPSVEEIAHVVAPPTHPGFLIGLLLMVAIMGTGALAR